MMVNEHHHGRAGGRKSCIRHVTLRSRRRAATRARGRASPSSVAHARAGAACRADPRPERYFEKSTFGTACAPLSASKYARALSIEKIFAVRFTGNFRMVALNSFTAAL